ncbi:MAG: hypothetical protein DWQ21_01715 [Bacteroidetes bacterium]|nr:MAG: hypothetical protein DWQ21_01715 [Bacteroidota bacterium]
MPKISSYPQIASVSNDDLFVVSDDSKNDATKSMTVEQLVSYVGTRAVKVGDIVDPAEAGNAGTFRYREVGNNSYIDLAMRTGASSYAWINIVQNNW